jgi:hypothetical protein
MGSNRAAAALLAVMLGCGPAVAQSQMQEHAVGSRGHWHHWRAPHRWDQAPPAKPSAAECRARARQRHLRGVKADAFVKACLRA